MIILDTDHLTLLQWGGVAGQKIQNRLRHLDLAQSPPTTIVSCEEQLRGWLSQIAHAKTVGDQVNLYSKLNLHIQFFATLHIVRFSEAAATEFQRLTKLRIRIGTMDLKIAAIALAENATLWTRNRRDFQQVPGLLMEDASK